MNSFLIKIGGEIVDSPQMDVVAKGILELQSAGFHGVLVHGGGAQATAMQKKLGQTPNIVAGRRITDEKALDVMKMVVGGQLNIQVCSALMKHGLNPIGLNGASSSAIKAEKRPPVIVSGGGNDPIDFGHVGDVKGVNIPLLQGLMEMGHVPVLACLGADHHGNVFNINADVVANQCSKHLKAKHLFLVTKTPGVLTNKDDPTTTIPRLTPAKAKELIADGTIVDGMIPKIEESFKLISESDLSAIHIVGQLAKGDLQKALNTPGSVGTALLQN